MMHHREDGSPVTLGWLYDDEEPMPERPLEVIAEDDAELLRQREADGQPFEDMESAA